jgi:hypothetical protein
VAALLAAGAPTEAEAVGGKTALQVRATLLRRAAAEDSKHTHTYARVVSPAAPLETRPGAGVRSTAVFDTAVSA